MKASDALQIYKDNEPRRKEDRKRFIQSDLDEIMNCIKFSASRTTSICHPIVYPENIEALTKLGYIVTKEDSEEVYTNDHIISWEDSNE